MSGERSLDDNSQWRDSGDKSCLLKTSFTYKGEAPLPAFLFVCEI
jgi:hypothetical protein